MPHIKDTVCYRCVMETSSLRISLLHHGTGCF